MRVVFLKLIIHFTTKHLNFEPKMVVSLILGKIFCEVKKVLKLCSQFVLGSLNTGGHMGAKSSQFYFL